MGVAMTEHDLTEGDTRTGAEGNVLTAETVHDDGSVTFTVENMDDTVTASEEEVAAAVESGELVADEQSQQLKYNL